MLHSCAVQRRRERRIDVRSRLEERRLRIIAGELRGRRLASPAPGVRPTSDRVRESMFARLGDLSGANVLDLFAGSGALGIEAISRGADGVTFVDRAGRVVAALERTLGDLGIGDRARVVRSEAAVAIRRLAGEDAVFDLIFVDPPYADHARLGELLDAVVRGGLLAPDAVVVVECAKRHAVAPILETVGGLSVESTRSYGDTSVTWLVPEHGAGQSGGPKQR